MIIAVFEMVCLVINVIGAIFSFATGAISASAFAGGLVAPLVAIVVVSLLIAGIQKEKHLYVIPHIILQVRIVLSYLAVAIWSLFQILTIIGFIVGSIVVFVLPYTLLAASHAIESLIIVTAVCGVFMLLFVGLEAFFLYVIIKCYRYLKDISQAGMTMNYHASDKA